MSRSSSKTFDCVESVRNIRDRISAEIAQMDHEQLVRWLRSHCYTDPLLKRLAERVGRQAEVRWR